jgi:hypothetical protein
MRSDRVPRSHRTRSGCFQKDTWSRHAAAPRMECPHEAFDTKCPAEVYTPSQNRCTTILQGQTE